MHPLNAPRWLRGGAAVLGLFACPAAHARTAADDAGRGQALFQDQCSLCHAVRGGHAGQGPNLAGVVGRRAGSTRFGYSHALRSAGFSWDTQHLDAYLTNPAHAVPGTIMPVRVASAEERRFLIAYLGSIPGSAGSAAPAVGAGAPADRTVGEAAATPAILSGQAAFGDWHDDRPGVRRHITVADLPPPFATGSAGNSPSVVDRPAGTVPLAPRGFKVDLFADGLDAPRLLRTAPNGDIFVAETAAGRIRILRAAAGSARATVKDVFADGLDAPFGIAFYPAGANPEWIYVAENNAVLRFPYRNGDLHERGASETVVPRLTRTTGGHSTRDLAFSPDGARLFVSVGSASNVAEGLASRTPEAIGAWERDHALGSAWGREENRADVLAYAPDGSRPAIFATGLRNCVGLAVEPGTGDLWCSTNERDELGDNLVPDYLTRVRQGAFYGWPWYYLGDHEDPRLKGQRPDLRGRVTVPDVLIQPHSASLQMTFYDGSAFPAGFRGAFAAEHGSWNRDKRTGYKVVRVLLDAQGHPTGEYEDFLTGFVVGDDAVWGRPVGVTVTRDGALLVSEDASGTIWRVSWQER